MGKVLIGNNLMVHGILGINDWEREQPQEIVIDVVLFTDVSRAGMTDEIADCVNYATLVDMITAHVESARRFTVEALATDIARIGLEQRRVERVLVRVQKPGAIRSCRSVGVEIERVREGESPPPWSTRGNEQRPAGSF